MNVLRQKAVVDFDPENQDHVRAAMNMILHCKIHEDLRFAVPPPFLSFPTYAMYCMARRHAEHVTKEKYEDSLTVVNGSNAAHLVMERSRTMRAGEIRDEYLAARRADSRDGVQGFQPA